MRNIEGGWRIDEKESDIKIDCVSKCKVKD